MSKQWLVKVESPHSIHVTPLDDEEAHIEITREEELPFGSWPVCDCRCRPKRLNEGEGRYIFVHNSFDGREGVEWANELLSKKNG